MCKVDLYPRYYYWLLFWEITGSVVLNGKIRTRVNFASCSETVGFQFEILDVFHSLSVLIHMICDGGDVPETGTRFEFKCSLVKSICKMNSCILKLNINCITQYFVFLSLGKDFQSAGKSEPLTYFIWGEKLIKDTTYLQSPQLKKTKCIHSRDSLWKDF